MMWALFKKIDGVWYFKGFTKHEEFASEFEDDAKLEVDDGVIEAYKAWCLDD